MLTCSPLLGIAIDHYGMNSVFSICCHNVIVMGCSMSLTFSLFLMAHTSPCNGCWDPYYSIGIFGISVALIAPSVNPSIPLLAGKDRLVFAFSLFRALAAASAGFFILLLGVVQSNTVAYRGGYYWVPLCLVAKKP